MWLSFALAAAVITFFAARMAEELRRQEELRAIRREEGLRDQQLLAVATQAAGAAHELGTPLATMSVLLKEMRQDHPDPMLQDDLKCCRIRSSCAKKPCNNWCAPPKPTAAWPWRCRTSPTGSTKR
jgi:two-component system sensor histidine kinase RegB